MVSEGRLEWRRTALDLPLALLIALVAAQIAVGNRPLMAWALALPAASPDPSATLPIPFFLLGTVAPRVTARSLLLFLTYAGVYYLIVNLIRERRQLDRLVRTLLVFGGVLAFFGLVDYLTGEARLLRSHENTERGRLAGTFVNPDHFAAWLAMLVCLGLGYLTARHRNDAERLGFSALLGSREGRERMIRRYLPFIGISVMAVALVFTLSRGAVLSLLATLAVLLALLARLGRTRWSIAVIGTLLAVTLGYGAWIGFAPFLTRVWQQGYTARWLLSLTTLRMLAEFPLGVGLGAYKEIYFRYQPLALNAGKVYYPYAHNDLLQLAVELGLIGTPIALFAVWRVARDLLAAHLFGRGHCPVGGGEGDGAKRRHPFSVGIALGGLGAVLALVLDSGFDFAARIPANGVLAAACLGIATVALHTRFSEDEQLLTAVRTCRLGSARYLLLAARVGTVAVALALVPALAIPVLIEDRLQPVRGVPDPMRVEEALKLDSDDPLALAARARLRLNNAVQVWNLGLTPTGMVTSHEERRREALALLNGAIEDLRTAMTSTPSSPFLHERLAWAYGTLAAIDPSGSATRAAAAITHFYRAIALAPENAFLHRSLAAFAASRPQSLVQVGLGAAREAIRLDADLLPDLVERYLPLNLAEAQWLAFAPDSALDRLQLAATLEARGRLGEAGAIYRKATELAEVTEAPLIRWLHARLLIQERDYRSATAELDSALRLNPENPELHLARADALAALGDPAALDAYRTAVEKAEMMARKSVQGPLFRVAAPQAHTIGRERLGRGNRVVPAKYRLALGLYLTDRKLWEQALEELDGVLAESPEEGLAHFGRGIALDGLGAKNKAVEAYRKAVTLDGRSTRFRLRLAETLWETDQYYQAINEWRTVIRLAPSNIEARLALARAYLKVGDRIEAFREYQRVLELTPDNSEARLGLRRLGGGS